jgi:hypothetical protein
MSVPDTWAASCDQANLAGGTVFPGQPGCRGTTSPRNAGPSAAAAPHRSHSAHADTIWVGARFRGACC